MSADAIARKIARTIKDVDDFERITLSLSPDSREAVLMVTTKAGPHAAYEVFIKPMTYTLIKDDNVQFRMDHEKEVKG